MGVIILMKNLVILGGGYGGLKTLLGLLGQGVPDDVKITLIDKNPYHSLKTEFYTIAAGTSAEKDVRVQYPDDDRVNYMFARVSEIDVKDRKSTRLNSSHVAISYAVSCLK